MNLDTPFSDRTSPGDGANHRFLAGGRQRDATPNPADPSTTHGSG